MEAVEQLGELVYIDFVNDPGTVVSKNDDLAIIESVKATDAVNAPYDCEIVEINAQLEDPEYLETLSQDAENEETSWLLKIKKV